MIHALSLSYPLSLWMLRQTETADLYELARRSEEALLELP